MTRSAHAGDGIDFPGLLGPIDRLVTRRPLLKAFCVAAGATALPTGLVAGAPMAHAAVNHPGLLHTDDDFTRMREKVRAGEQPWKGAWDQLVASRNSQTNWGPRATSVIRRGVAPDNVALLFNDTAAAYQNALRWKISEDEAHAKNAVRHPQRLGIHAHRGHGQRGPLPRRRDLRLSVGQRGRDHAGLRGLGSRGLRDVPGHDAAGSSTRSTTTSWSNHNGAHITNYWANWDLCNMASILAIGVLCDDQAKIDEAITYFKSGAGNGSIHHAVPFLHLAHPRPVAGKWPRHRAHTLMGVGLMAAICEMAWNQGVDLYGYADKRFLGGAEYVARYTNLKDVPFAYYSWHLGQRGDRRTHHVIAADDSRGGSRTIWDTIVGHYAHRLGLHLPEVEEKAAANRPDGGPAAGMHPSAFDHLGFTTLTHYRGPIPTKVPTGVYVLTSRHSGKALTARDNGTANGTVVEQQTIADPFYDDSQQWIVEDLGTGQYRILGAFSGRALDINGASTANGAKVQLWDDAGGNHQRFTLTPTDSGYFRVTAIHSGKTVAIGGSSTADGVAATQWQNTGGADQQWKLSPVSTVRRLRLAGTTNQYIRHSGFRAQVGVDPFPAQDSEFRIVTGLAGPTGISLESVNFPGRYLRVRPNAEVWIEQSDGTSGFADNATFRRLPGLADASLHSYRMWTDSTRYLVLQSGVINAAPASDPALHAAATFAEVPASPPTPPPSTPTTAPTTTPLAPTSSSTVPLPSSPAPGLLVSATALAVSSRPGKPLKLVARVKVPLGAPATGRVRFAVDGVVIVKKVGLTNGKAVLLLSERQLRKLGQGKHRVTATYLGSATTKSSRGKASFNLR